MIILIYYICDKLGYLLKNYCSNNIMTKKLMNTMFKDDFELKENIEREKIAINLHTLKFSLDNKYFYI